MSNLSCVIVDDEQDSIELLARRISYLYRNIEVIGTYTNWSTAFDALREQSCDLLFMDISMPEKTGFELLKLLPGITAEIIFVTAHDNFALDAFSFAATGYLLKPVDDIELSNAIKKATERIQNKRLALQNNIAGPLLNQKIGIPNNHGIDYVNIKDIIYLESTNKCTKIVTMAQEYISSHNLGKFQYFIDHHSFYQVHRSFIINLNYILRYESSQMVIMTNKKEVPVSRNIKNDFLKLFNDLN